MRPFTAALAFCALAGCASAPVRAPVAARLGLDEAAHRPFIRAGVAARPPAALSAAAPAPASVRPGARERILELARAQVGRKRVQLGGRTWPDDCTGLVKGLFAQEGLDLTRLGQAGDNGVGAIWRFAQGHGQTYRGGHPVPGDLVFFQETYDKNRDGARNDGLTHVGLVDALEPDGTVLVIHKVARGVVRYRMNLGRPDQAAGPGGRVWNDWLRPAQAGQRPQLTAQLFFGYATLLPVEPRYAQR